MPPHWTAAYVGGSTLHVAQAEQTASAVALHGVDVYSPEGHILHAWKTASDVAVQLEIMKLPARLLVHGKHTVFSDTLHAWAK